MKSVCEILAPATDELVALLLDREVELSDTEIEVALSVIRANLGKPHGMTISDEMLWGVPAN